MTVIVSLVIGGLTPDQTHVTVSPNIQVIRQDLVEFYNDAVGGGGLDDEAQPLPEDAGLQPAIDAIQKWVGRHVLILETEVIDP